MSSLYYADTLDEIFSVVSDHEFVLIEFGAEWCGPCKKFLPHFEKFAEQHPEIACVKVDIEVDPEVVSFYKIQSVPQVKFFKYGEFSRDIQGRTVLKLNQEIAS